MSSKNRSSHNTAEEPDQVDNTESNSSLESVSKPNLQITNLKSTKRTRKIKKQKRPKTRGRRVEKRRPKKKQKKEQWEDVHSMYSALSSLSFVGAFDRKCKYCGHRCCLRRFERAKGNIKCTKKKKMRVAGKPKIITGTQCLQAGSRCDMLSPLFISSTPPGPVQPPTQCCEITPEILYQSLRVLTMWKQGVDTLTIFEYILAHYPVNLDEEAAAMEFLDKLYIAELVGIVKSMPIDSWCLPSMLEKAHNLPESHVTQFWKVYGDTLTPRDDLQLIRLIRAEKEAKEKKSVNKCDPAPDDIV